MVDNRVDRSLHFIGEWIYDAMYVNPRKKAGDILADPKSKLELYIAYRLSSTSIWAILVANVAGYMLVRAAAPTGVYILKFVGVTSNVKQKLAGRTGEFEPIKLVRPQLGWPLYLAQFANLLVIYWIFWIDPATQSHYYITTECDDWAGLGVHVPSGAFGTTWGKRRYARFGEHLIGILLVFTFLFVVFQQCHWAARWSTPLLVKEATQVKLGTTARLDKVALIMIGFALIIQLLFISQSIVSGDDWYRAIKASDNDHAMLETFSKDVLMSVWAAFWTSVSISWYRQKWADRQAQGAVPVRVDGHAACCCCGCRCSSPRRCWPTRSTWRSRTARARSDTPRLIIYIFIYAVSAIWTALLLIRLKAVYNAIPDKTTSKQAIASGDKVSAKKAQVKAAIAAAEAAKAEEERGALFDFISSAPAERPMFNLSGMVVPAATAPVRPQRKTDAVYMPLLPSQLHVRVYDHSTLRFRGVGQCEREGMWWVRARACVCVVVVVGCALFLTRTGYHSRHARPRHDSRPDHKHLSDAPALGRGRVGARRARAARAPGAMAGKVNYRIVTLVAALARRCSRPSPWPSS